MTEQNSRLEPDRLAEVQSLLGRLKAGELDMLGFLTSALELGLSVAVVYALLALGSSTKSEATTQSVADSNDAHLRQLLEASDVGVNYTLEQESFKDNAGRAEPEATAPRRMQDKWDNSDWNNWGNWPNHPGWGNTPPKGNY